MSGFRVFFIKRYLSAFFVVSAALTLLTLVIEFFEKLYRVSGASFASIMKYLGWYALPIMLQNMPTALWLATCFIIYDFWVGETWFFLRMVGVIPRALYKLIFSLSFIVMIVALVSSELFITQFADKAEYVRLKYFKHKDTTKTYGLWFELAQGGVGYVGMFDPSTLNGKRFLKITTDSVGMVERVITAPLFTFDQETNLIRLSNSITYDQKAAETLVKKSSSIHQPELAISLKAAKKAQTLTGILKRLIIWRTALPQGLFKHFIQLVALQALFFMSFILFPSVTLALFVHGEHMKYAWLLLFSAYPLVKVFLQIIELCISILT